MFTSYGGTPPKFTSDKINDIMCWALNYGLDGLITADPLALAVAETKIYYTQLCLDEGVVYGSKGADYAESLPKEIPDQKFNLGSVVGIRNGKVSFNTKDADQVMVVSSRPVVLGNQPPKGEESAYETVAFIGQASTLVRGHCESGDYVISSGLNDGTGLAIKPENLKLSQVSRIVGRAWSDSKNDYISYVNVAVGLNTNELAKITMKAEERMASLESSAENQQTLLINQQKEIDELKGMVMNLIPKNNPDSKESNASETTASSVTPK
jgi:hypothetical protein